MTSIQGMMQALAILGACSIGAAGCIGAPDNDPALSSIDAPLNISQWTINAKVPGMSSKQSPALAAMNGVAYLNHSSQNDTPIWWARFTQNGWTGDSPVPGQASNATPSLAAFNGALHMLHLSATSGATQVWHTQLDPVTLTWTPNSMLSFNSVGTPAIQAFNSRLQIIGVTPGSLQLWQAEIIGNNPPSNFRALSGMFSATPVSLAVLDNRLYMVHRTGVFHDMVLNSSPDGIAWGPDVQIDGGFDGGLQTVPDQPAIAAYGGVLHLVHNETNHPGIWWSYYTPSTSVWTSEVAFPAPQSMAGFAALAPLPNQLLMVHHGATENTLWYSIFQ